MNEIKIYSLATGCIEVLYRVLHCLSGSSAEELSIMNETDDVLEDRKEALELFRDLIRTEKEKRLQAE